MARPPLPTPKNYVVEPPDIVRVEVPEALPGQPISGERLVRPDGKISLGFYGEVYVAGLTVPEVKEKIVLQLRKYLGDELLGLLERDPATGDYKRDQSSQLVRKPPRESDRVVVDVATVNSKNFYILGEVLHPGKFPITGNETVLDALQFAGGLLPAASPQNIRLVRPAPRRLLRAGLGGLPDHDYRRRRPDHELSFDARGSHHRLFQVAGRPRRLGSKVGRITAQARGIPDLESVSSDDPG